MNKPIEYNHEQMFDKYKLTNEQVKACKKVFKAFRDADKLGVKFWDMYGTITAYNGKVFSSITMEPESNSIQVINAEGEELTYSERLNNFKAGCSDDNVYLILK